MTQTVGHFINSSTVAPSNGSTVPVYNPATGEAEYELEMATPARVEEAIASAKQAFPGWAATTPLNRARVMFRLKALIEENADELTQLITREHGKVYSDARGELTRGLEVIEFACGAPQLLKGEHSNNVGGGVDSWTLMQPLGVCAGITPFNFPAMVPMWMYPVAIACGNTFVLKPSEKVPAFSMRIAELFKEAGLPDGVFNVVNGDKTAVDTLLSHEDVKAISFVGSTPIAKYIYETASHYGKRVQALGGAKNHMVIMPDANMEVVANALMGAAFGSAGERCMAISVAVPVGEGTAERLLEALLPKVKEITVGNGLSKPEPHMGPLVSKEHRDRVKSYVDLGVEEGASLLVDGRTESAAESGGYFLGASVFDHVTPSMRIYLEEIFGPVLAIVRAESSAEALQLINDHEFGNGTTVFTADGNTGREFVQNVQCGMVGINVPIPVPMAFHSFGGWKNSLFGVNHVHGPDGVRFYTRMKTVTSRWTGMAKTENAFSMPTMS